MVLVFVRQTIIAPLLLVIYGFIHLGVVDGLSLAGKAGLSRREVLIGGSLAGVTGGSFFVFPENAAATPQEEKAPIAVVGANGRTGSLCVTACLQRGLPVRALTRSGSWSLPVEMAELEVASNKLLTVAACDVKDYKALENGVTGCRGVIYAASASKNGGNALEIDNVGVVDAAKACLKADVTRYIVISSTATTRPNSLGYKFTNVFGGIMDEKRKGEEGVITLYDNDDRSMFSYTIIRPGGLEEPKKNEVLGPKALELSQGDVLAGIVSRADLAEVAVELALSTAANLKNTALEVYYEDSVQPSEFRFRPFLKNGVVPRLHGETYEDLLRGIQPNVDYYVPS